jgi:uncharacterized protein YchJ
MREKNLNPARPVLCLLAALAAHACAGAYTPQEKLNQTATTYYEAFRWSKVQEMSECIPEQDRQSFIEGFNDAFEGINIVDYEIREMKLDKSKKTATVTFAFSWHPEDDTYVRETVVQDTWASKGGKWYRVGQEIIEGEKP